MLIHYHATGSVILTLHDSARITGTFVLEQYANAQVVLDCTLEDRLAAWQLVSQHVTAVNGTTTDGQALTTRGPLHLTSIQDQGCTLRLHQVIIGDPTTPPAQHEFALTNLFFPDKPGPTALTLSIDEQPITITLTPHPEYRKREHFSSRHKHPAVTATLTLRVPDQPQEWITGLVNDLCYALSIVQGHKISWIDQHARADNGTLLWVHLNNHVTKPPSALLLDYAGGNRSHPPLSLVPGVFARVRDYQAQYHWNGPLIDAWLDARPETDYTEARSLKYVIVIETLRRIVLENHSHQHLEVAQWEEFLAYALPHLRLYLSAGMRLHPDKVSTLTNPDRWQELNRKGFRAQILATFKRLKITASHDAITTFIACRNTLVHEGRFRCQATPDALPSTATEEYLFIAGFVDGTIMQLFGVPSDLAPPSATENAP